MPSTIDFEFGDVVLVPFPFTDQRSIKKRPALVVSSDAFHAHRSDLILMAVTSRFRNLRPGDVEIREWTAAGLLKPSRVKPIVTTLEKRLVLRKLGRLAGTDLQALQKSLRIVFAL